LGAQVSPGFPVRKGVGVIDALGDFAHVAWAALENAPVPIFGFELIVVPGYFSVFLLFGQAFQEHSICLARSIHR
jgi:hypothetical protein